MRNWFIFSLFLSTSSAVLAADSDSALSPAQQALEKLTPERFAQCLGSFSEKAKEAGVSDKTLSEVLNNSELQTKVIEYDRNQPEFVRTFPTYLTKRVNDWRINKGVALLKEHEVLLQDLYKRYGIPPHYLVSFWGLETNFGAYKGKMPIIDSLATLACDERRSEFFTKELILALQLVEREGISRDKMLGSWAGAMGHTQFMPSAYMQYAMDGDGDGRVDLWNSVPDALTSAANFLHNLGWKPGFRWGREVILPESFDYKSTGRENVKNLTQWNNIGITKADGTPLGNSDQLQASVLSPSGHKGPAFLVYDNFAVIMKWNFSEFYAIAVGHLADRLVGGLKLQQPLPDIPTYSIAEVKNLQMQLNELGFDVGVADGILGPATRKGIQGFQIANNLVADGFPYPQLFEAVQQAKEASNLL